jgi:hypothetical protein
MRASNQSSRSDSKPGNRKNDTGVECRTLPPHDISVIAALIHSWISLPLSNQGVGRRSLTNREAIQLKRESERTQIAIIPA